MIGILPDAMPHDSVQIIDQSSYTSTTPSTVSDPIGFFGFVSPKGIGFDKNLVQITPANVAKYGVPNFAKWGVSLYNVNQYIYGGGTVLGMRLVADDSCHANLAVIAKYKLVTAEPLTNSTGQPLFKDASGNMTTVSTGNTAIVRDVMKVVLTTQSFTQTNATSPGVLQSALDALKNDVADTNGFKTCPLFVIYNAAKGTFGNNRSVRFSFDSTMESTVNTDRFYRVTAIDYDNNTSLFAPMVMTLDSDYIYDGVSMFATDVFSQYNQDLQFLPSTFLPNFLASVDAMGLDSTNGELNHNYVDILFGLTKSNNNHFKYELDPTSVSLSAPTGLMLAGGSDGAFDPTATSRDTNINTMMASCYNGLITDAIYDEIRYPFIHIFDNSDDVGVKAAVDSLASKRYTSLAILSMPNTITTYTQADSLRTSTFKFSSFKTVMYTESAMTFDQFTGKNIRMPASYFNAFAYASHCGGKGYATPFAGQYLSWTGMVPNTVVPQTTNVTVFQQEHNNRVNQMIDNGDGTAQPYQQITTQSTMSKLSEINNVHILLMMIRIAIQISNNSRWGSNGDTDIVKFQKKLKDAIDLQMNGTYDHVDIVAQKESANGAGADRILCTLNVYFKDVLKGVSYQFYIV